MSDGCQITIDAGMLLKMVKSTIMAAGKARHDLLLISVEPDKLSLYATDGHRRHVASCSLHGGNGIEVGINRKMAKTLIDTIKHVEGEVVVDVGESLVIWCGNRTVCTLDLSPTISMYIPAQAQVEFKCNPVRTVNPRYMSDVMDAVTLTGGVAEMETSDKLDPIVVRASDDPEHARTFDLVCHVAVIST